MRLSHLPSLSPFTSSYSASSVRLGSAQAAPPLLLCYSSPPPITANSVFRLPVRGLRRFSPSFQMRLFGLKLQRRIRRVAEQSRALELPGLVDFATLSRKHKGRTGYELPVSRVKLPKKGITAEIKLTRTNYHTDPEALHITATDASGTTSYARIDVSKRTLVTPNSTPIVITEARGPLFEGLSKNALTRELYEILHADRRHDSPLARPYVQEKRRFPRILKAIGRRLPL